MKSEPSISVYETIYRSLRSKIMFGEIDPGKSLTIRGLASEFSVSMTPIRDVIRRLVAEGALLMSRTGRISVPRIDNSRIEELLIIRTLLEPELGSRAIPRIHVALVERLVVMSKLIEKMIQEGDSIGYLKAKIGFHRTLYLRAQSPVMLTILETIWLQSGPTMKVAFDNNIPVSNISNHLDIISASKKNNSVEIAESIRADIKMIQCIF